MIRKNVLEFFDFKTKKGSNVLNNKNCKIFSLILVYSKNL